MRPKQIRGILHGELSGGLGGEIKEYIKHKGWVNLWGHLLLLLPLCITILVMSLPYVSASWRVLEGSPEVGGIPGIYLLKTLIPITAVLVALQAIAEILRLLLRKPEQG